MKRDPASTSLLQRSALGINHRHEIAPRLDERFRSLVLELGSESIDINSGLGELRQDLLAVAAIGRQCGANFAVIGECLQGSIRHSVHRKWGGQSLDVKYVGRFGILSSRAGP